MSTLGGSAASERFISIYQWVFGVKAPWLSNEDGKLLDGPPDHRTDITPEDISLVASAIELGRIWRIDDYGRFGIASDDEKSEILEALRVYGHMRETLHPLEVEQYEAGISELHAVPEWHMFGWKKKDKPDFEYCYKVRTKQMRPSNDLDPEFAVRTNDKKWDLLVLGVRACLSQLNELNGLEGEKKLKKYEEVINDMLDSDSRSTYTEKLIKIMSRYEITIDAKTLKKALREVPDRLRTFR